MKIKKLLLAMCASLILVAPSCKDDDAGSDPVPSPEQSGELNHVGAVTGITVSTPEVLEVSSSSVTLSATMSSLSSLHSAYLACSANPDMSNATTLACRVLTSPTFKGTISGLNYNSTYYVCALLKSTKEPDVYSEVVSITTADVTNVDDYVGPKYADDYRNFSSWDKRSSWNLANVHDPSVVLADDGYYYMYQTDASFGNVHVGHGHFHARRSKNLIDWEYLGASMENVPSWVLTKCNEFRSEMGLPAITTPVYGCWAPSVRKVRDGLYRMYYSIVMDNYIGSGKPNKAENFDGTWTERAFIGVMETSDPASNVWEDRGYVLCSSSDKGTDYKRSSLDDWSGYFYFNAIDPSYVITESGEHWLIYGSWHSGIAAVQLNPETGKTLAELPKPWGSLADIAPYGKRIYTRLKSSRWQASEGPEVVFHDGYYYLFLANDGLDVPYHTRVVRSRSILGPYVGINGTDCTSNGGDAFPIVTHPYAFSGSRGWVGFSHCAVFEDDKGNWFYASQARFPNSASDTWVPNAVMVGHVRSIVWSEDGWPLVLPERFGNVPAIPVASADMVGSWEVIDLVYDYQKTDNSVEMSLASDGTVSAGLWKGKTWSFDESKQILNVGGVKFYVRRECDWEASPRVATLVFAGVSGTKTYWGKRH